MSVGEGGSSCAMVGVGVESSWAWRSGGNDLVALNGTSGGPVLCLVILGATPVSAPSWSLVGNLLVVV